jgi:uncharacterized membrane protein (DUF373 family)
VEYTTRTLLAKAVSGAGPLSGNVESYASMATDDEQSWGVQLARLLRLAEEAVYILIGLLLVLAAVGLLIVAGIQFIDEVRSDPHGATLALLDTLLLVLMLAEILYTLVVTLVEHVLVLRPFLIIALIAAVRRILVLTAAQASLVSASAEHFQRTIIELILHAGLILVLVISLVLLRRNNVES